MTSSHKVEPSFSLDDTISTQKQRPARLWLISDLHADHSAWTPPSLMPTCDALLVAGDVGEDPVRSVDRLEQWFGEFGVPIICVAGNHEGYGFDWHARIDRAIERAAAGGVVRLLERDTIDIAPKGAVRVRVYGTTLWTDYRLDGAANQLRRMQAAGRGMMDHQMIRAFGRLFTPEDALTEHEASARWLEGALHAPFDGGRVVLTHHAPHHGCLDPRYEHDPLNPAYASDLSSLIARHRPQLWVHGHVHHANEHRPSVDGSGEPGSTRVVCNPRGYRHEQTGWREDLVIEVTA